MPDPGKPPPLLSSWLGLGRAARAEGSPGAAPAAGALARRFVLAEALGPPRAAAWAHRFERPPVLAGPAGAPGECGSDASPLPRTPGEGAPR